MNNRIIMMYKALEQNQKHGYIWIAGETLYRNQWLKWYSPNTHAKLANKIGDLKKGEKNEG